MWYASSRWYRHFSCVHPSSSASPLFPHSKPISSLISDIKPFIFSPNTIYKRHKGGFHCVSLGVSSYDTPRSRKESSLQYGAWGFRKRVPIKKWSPSMEKISNDISNCNYLKVSLTSPILSTAYYAKCSYE